MSQENPTLIAKSRERVGSRYAKRVRETGGLPAVVYGHKQDPQPITLDFTDASMHIKKGEKVFSMNIDGKAEFVLLKDIGYDYLGTNIIHADFARVDLNERVDTSVHLKFVGEPKGLKNAGAILMHPVNELEINCQVINLPDVLEVDVSGLDVDDMIKAGDIKLPVSTMKLLTDPDTVVAQVSVMVEQETAEAATVDDAAAPAVVGEKKKKEED
jgi:large subunit ribosomal protein L25